MKKSFKLFAAALMALAMIVPAQAEELTIYEGTESKEDAPINGQYIDVEGVLTQVIYPASSLTDLMGKQINSLTFYLLDEGGNPLSDGTIEVSMGMTTQSSFPTYAPTPITDLTHLANVTMNQGETEIFIEFDEPFLYEGDNLVIETKTAVAGSSYAHLHFAGVWETGTYNILSKLNYSNGTASSFYPMVTFDYGTDEFGARVTPSQLAFGQIYPDQVGELTLTVKNIGANAFTPTISGLSAPYSIEPAAAEIAPGTSVQYTVTFAPTELGDYPQTLTIDCLEAGLFEIPVTGALVERPLEVVVGEGATTGNNLPIYGIYYDTEGTLGQMIYTEEMLADLVGKKITKLVFRAADPLAITDGNIQLSFKVVEQEGFTEAVGIDEMVVVANGAPVAGETELVFILDEPYEYNGGNLAIEALVTEPNNWKSTSFIGDNLGYKPSFYHYMTSYGSTDQISTFLPQAVFTYAKEEAPAYERGDVNHDRDITIADVTKLISMVLLKAPYAVEADVNYDNELTIADVSILIGRVLKGTW